MVLSVRLRSAVALAGRYPVLAGVDLDIVEGEVLVLRGPNGAGKTSLLRVLAGLLPLSAGEISVLGLDPVAESRALRPQVGLLGHRNGLYDDLSARDNVRFAVRASRLPGRSVDGALDRMGLSGRLRDLPAGRLSAGQRRRVALAALAARSPRLWLLDEPHAGLDSEHRSLLDDLLGDVAGEGATVVLASHEVLPEELTSRRMAYMAGGMVVEGGGPVPDTAVTDAGTDGVVPAAETGGAVTLRWHGDGQGAEVPSVA
jgi:heme ABC exporter ATP-binding subunit CcmA